ncbi:MAG: hypothetical protein AB1714_30015 [Acidobacteriota bacterium]
MFQVIVTCDLDAENQNNARFEIDSPAFDYRSELGEAYNYFADNGTPLTVFVRIDRQVTRFYDDYFVHELALRAYESSRRPDVQFGWHPHCFRCTEGGSDLIREETEIVEELLDVFARTSALLRHFTSVRIGALQSGNEVMRCIEDMGFRFDSSALAGCRRQDRHRHYDWSRASNRPYRPSVNDYQASGDPAHSFLEVPITTVPMRTSYDSVPRLRAINPVIRPEILRPALAEALPELQRLGFMVVLFHADELKTGYQDDLYTYGMENFRRAMDHVDDTLLHGIPHEYVKLEDFRWESGDGAP